VAKARQHNNLSAFLREGLFECQPLQGKAVLPVILTEKLSTTKMAIVWLGCRQSETFSPLITNLVAQNPT